LALDRGKWLASLPCYFTPEERAPGLDRRLGVTQSWSGCGGKEKKKILPLPEIKLVIQPIAQSLY